MAAWAATLRRGGASEITFTSAVIVSAQGSDSLRYLCVAFFSRFRYPHRTIALVGGLDVAESDRNRFFHLSM